MRRLLALLLLLLMLPSLLVGCGGPAPTDEEIKQTASRLIAGSLLPNTVFLGDGIPAEEWAFDGYRYADEDWMQEYSMRTVEALTAAAEAVYTDAVVAMLTRYACFDSTEEMPHYRNRTVEEGLLVLDARTGLFEGLVFNYKTEDMTVEQRSATGALVSLTVEVSRAPGETREKSLHLPLVRTEDGWRLDKLTYVAYEDVD